MARLTVFRHFFAPVADFTYTNLWHGWDLNFTYSTTFRGQFVRHYQRTIEYERRCRRPHGNKTFFIIRYVQVREGDLNENVNVQSGSFGLLCFEDKHLINQIIYLLGQKHIFSSSHFLWYLLFFSVLVVFCCIYIPLFTNLKEGVHW